MLDFNSEALDYVRLLSYDYTTRAEYSEFGIAIPDCGLTINTFIIRCNTGQIQQPLDYQSYLANTDIINAIKAYQIDVDKFWYALLFIYDYVQAMCINKEGLKSLPSNKQQLEMLYDYLEKYPDAEITLKHPAVSKKDVLVLGNNADFGQCLIFALNTFFPVLKNCITKEIDRMESENAKRRKAVKKHPQLLKERIEMTPEDRFVTNLLAGLTVKSTPEFQSASVMMTLATKMYRTLFDKLKLPDMQNVYTTENVSYNKMLLISRIVYLYRYTTNESYLVNEDSLRKIFKDYKDKRIDTPADSLY